jgi:hypothetical protein
MLKSGSCQTDNCGQFGIVYELDVELYGELLVCGECQNFITLTAVND